MTFLEQFVATTTRSRHTGTTFPLFPLLASDKGRFSSHDNPPLYATGTCIVRRPLRSFPSYALPVTLTVDSGHVIVKRLCSRRSFHRATSFWTPSIVLFAHRIDVYEFHEEIVTAASSLTNVPVTGSHRCT